MKNTALAIETGTGTNSSKNNLMVVHNKMNKPTPTIQMVSEKVMKEMKFYESDLMDLTRNRGVYSTSNIGYSESWNLLKSAFYMDFFISKIEAKMEPITEVERNLTQNVYFKMYGQEYKMNKYSYYKIMRSLDKKFMKGWFGGMKRREGGVSDLENILKANFSVKIKQANNTISKRSSQVGYFQCFCTYYSKN